MSTRVRGSLTLSLVSQARECDLAATASPPVTPAALPASCSESSRIAPEAVAQYVQTLKGSADWFVEQVDLIAGMRGRWTQASVDILEQACARYRAEGEPAREVLARMEPTDLLAGLRLLYEQLYPSDPQPDPPTLSVHQGGRE